MTQQFNRTKLTLRGWEEGEEGKEEYPAHGEPREPGCQVTPEGPEVPLYPGGTQAGIAPGTNPGNTQGSINSPCLS